MTAKTSADASEHDNREVVLSLAVTDHLARAIHARQPSNTLYNLASRLQTMAVEYGLADMTPPILDIVVPAHPLPPGKVKIGESYHEMTVPLFRRASLTDEQAAEAVAALRQMTGIVSAGFAPAPNNGHAPVSATPHLRRDARQADKSLA